MAPLQSRCVQAKLGTVCLHRALFPMALPFSPWLPLGLLLCPCREHSLSSCFILGDPADCGFVWRTLYFCCDPVAGETCPLVMCNLLVSPLSPQGWFGYSWRLPLTLSLKVWKKGCHSALCLAVLSLPSPYP